MARLPQAAVRTSPARAGVQTVGGLPERPERAPHGPHVSGALLCAGRARSPAAHWGCGPSPSVLPPAVPGGRGGQRARRGAALPSALALRCCPGQGVIWGPFSAQLRGQVLPSGAPGVSLVQPTSGASGFVGSLWGFSSANSVSRALGPHVPPPPGCQRPGWTRPPGQRCAGRLSCSLFGARRAGPLAVQAEESARHRACGLGGRSEQARGAPGRESSR